MIEIEIRRAGQAPRRVRLRDGAHGVGRHESNPIRLEDVEVSRRHARVLVDGDTVVIEDLGSNNGTLLGGAEVGRAVWASGAEVEVTPFLLSWRDPASDAPYFLVVEGAQAGERFPLMEDALSVGRGDDQDIVLKDQGASRSHAILVQKDGEWAIRDTGSANGLLLGGRPAREGYLRSGLEVQIGHTVLRFVDPTIPADEVAAFRSEDEPPTQLNTRGTEPETSLAMPAAPPDMIPPSASDAAMPVSTDSGNIGLLALVVSVMALVVLLALLMALGGQAP